MIISLKRITRRRLPRRPKWRKARQGDCTEHGVLLAALLRAKNIPARIDVGLVYVPKTQNFWYHLWTEAFIDGRWIPLDATQVDGGIGADHLTLGRSNLKGFQYPRRLHADDAGGGEDENRGAGSGMRGRRPEARGQRSEVREGRRKKDETNAEDLERKSTMAGEKKPFQFTLRSLFCVVFFVAATMALFGPFGILVFLLVLTIVNGVYHTSEVETNQGIVLVCLIVAVLLGVVVFGPFDFSRENPRKTACEYNLKQFGLSLDVMHGTLRSIGISKEHNLQLSPYEREINSILAEQ